MLLNIALIVSTIRVLIRVEFVYLSPQEIEKLEIQELKRRIEELKQQRLEREEAARKEMEQ